VADSRRQPHPHPGDVGTDEVDIGDEVARRGDPGHRVALGDQLPVGQGQALLVTGQRENHAGDRRGQLRTHLGEQAAVPLELGVGQFQLDGAELQLADQTLVEQSLLRVVVFLSRLVALVGRLGPRREADLFTGELGDRLPCRDPVTLGQSPAVSVPGDDQRAGGVGAQLDGLACAQRPGGGDAVLDLAGLDGPHEDRNAELDLLLVALRPAARRREQQQRQQCGASLHPEVSVSCSALAPRVMGTHRMASATTKSPSVSSLIMTLTSPAAISKVPRLFQPTSPPPASKATG